MKMTKKEAVPEIVDQKTEEGKSTDEEYEYIPPDGGWGWLVLCGSVTVSLLIPGTIKCFGVLLVEIFEVFKPSPVAASWILSLTYFLYSSLGPFTSFLSTKYGYRIVTIFGGLFAAFGMILSYFATNIVHLYICYGILVGLGAGLSFPPGVFIVTSYFVRLRGLANGIAISGSALGSIILPPFLRFLLETYGFKGAVLIMGGLILNVLVGASFYDPVQQHLIKVRVDKNKPNPITYKKCDILAKKNKKKKSPKETPSVDVQIYKNNENGENNFKVNDYSAVTEPLLEDTNSKIKNGTIVSKNIQNSESTGQINRKISTTSYMGKSVLTIGSTGQIARKTSSVSYKMPRVASAVTMSRQVSVVSNMSGSSFRFISTPFHGSTLVGLNPEFSSQLAIKPEKETRWFDCLLCCKKKDHKEPKQDEEEGLYSSLFRDPVFLIILISNASTAIGYINFTILLPTYAQTLGFDKTMGSYLLSIVSTFDLTGRIGGSALSDWLPIDKKLYYIVGLFVSGVALGCVPLGASYLYVSICSAVFGLASGTYVGITAIVMADILGEDRLASSYGVSLFVNGILQLIGPPVCGWFFEQIGVYGPIFQFLGIILISGAAVWLYLPCARRKKQPTFA
uniref:Major facilitator superfamily (MFS) profile domain-containing protein n=2 Tax=Clastoptera arizonana TaxID=38151 RepID=A0A1B6DJ57_9HEMI